MASFSASSKKHLAGAHPLLQRLFNEVIKEIDCTVLDSQRGKAEQEQAFRRGNSRAHFGQSPHNYAPSVSVDVVPYPLDWDDLKAFRALAKVVKAKAAALGIKVKHGATFKGLADWPHWELDPWRSYAKQSKLYTGK